MVLGGWRSVLCCDQVYLCFQFHRAQRASTTSAIGIASACGSSVGARWSVRTDHRGTVTRCKARRLSGTAWRWAAVVIHSHRLSPATSSAASVNIHIGGQAQEQRSRRRRRAKLQCPDPRGLRSLAATSKCRPASSTSWSRAHATWRASRRRTRTRRTCSSLTH